MKNTADNTTAKVRTGFSRMPQNGYDVNTRSQVQADGNVSATSEISKAGIYTIGIVSAIIGVWGFACFVGGLVASGGPLSFVGNWFKAVAGL